MLTLADRDRVVADTNIQKNCDEMTIAISWSKTFWSEKSTLVQTNLLDNLTERVSIPPEKGQIDCRVITQW